MEPIIGSKYVFKIKRNSDGTVERRKVRGVAQGFSQIPGVHYGDSYAPVVRLTTIRMLLSVYSGRKDVKFYHFDVATAFLWAPLEEELYMKPFPGMNINHLPGSRQVLRVRKAIYGLVQASAAWNKTFISFLTSLKFTVSDWDECLFFWKDKDRKDRFITLTLYVDDIIFASNDPKLRTWLWNKLTARFKCKDLGELNWTLGIMIERTETGYKLSQEQYALSILKRFRMDECNPVRSPESGLTLSKDQCPESDEDISTMQKVPYREAVGMLMFLMICTRPDLCHSIKMVAQFLNNPGVEHWNAVKRILQYLRGTTHLGLHLHGYSNSSPTYGIICDADDANNVDTSRSVHGVLSFIKNGDGISIFAWSAAFTPWVTRSACESEIVSIDLAHREGFPYRGMLEELGYKQGTTTIYQDCMGAQKLAEGPYTGHRKGSKHFRRRVFAIRHEVDSKIYSLEHLSSRDCVTDIIVTYKSVADFVRLRDQLLGYNYSAKFPKAMSLIEMLKDSKPSQTI